MIAGLEHWLRKEDAAFTRRPCEPGASALKLLRKLGVDRRCYVTSLDPAWDGRSVALEVVMGSLAGEAPRTALVRCSAGVAYYFHEELADLSSLYVSR